MDHVGRGKQISYTAQKELIEDLQQRYGDVFVINFEEFYVLQEKPLPNHYIRMARFEDFLIKRKEPEGCTTLKKLFEEQRPKAVLSRVIREGRLSSIGACSLEIVNEYTTGEKSSFQVILDDGASPFRPKRMAIFEIFETVYAK